MGAAEAMLKEETVRTFPCLEELTVCDCKQLRSAPSHFPSLKKLKIVGIESGMPIASILSNELTTLTHLRITDVKGLTSLPEGTLRNNTNLQNLRISYCSELRCIAPHGFDCCTFLQSLSIINCPKLRCLPDGLQYCTSLQHPVITRCPKITSIPIPIPSEGLHELTVSSCPELSSLPSGLGCSTSLVDLSVTECPKVTMHSLSPSLRFLTVSNADFLSTLNGGFTSLRLLIIRNCNQTELNIGDSLQALVSLHILTIRECPNLEDKLTSLCEMWILRCSRLTSLPTGLEMGSPYVFTHLKKLVIGPFWDELDSFPALQVLPQLESLSIYGWPKLKSLPEQIQHLTSLTYLWIQGFEGVEAIPEWLRNLASLETLKISSCTNLMYPPSIQAMQRLTKLNQLEIWSCPLLKERCSEESGGPEWPKISHIPRLDVL